MRISQWNLRISMDRILNRLTIAEFFTCVQIPYNVGERRNSSLALMLTQNKWIIKSVLEKCDAIDISYFTNRRSVNWALLWEHFKTCHLSDSRYCHLRWSHREENSFDILGRPVPAGTFIQTYHKITIATSYLNCCELVLQEQHRCVLLILVHQVGVAYLLRA